MNQAHAADLPLIWGYFATASSICLLVSAASLRGRGGAAEGLADDLDAVLPRGAPGGARVGHGRRDLGELVVVLLGDARVDAEDEVGLGRRDLLDRDAGGVVVAGDLGVGVELGDAGVEPVGRALRVAAPGDLRGADGRTPRETTTSASFQPTVATRLGSALTVVSPKACLTVVGNASLSTADGGRGRRVGRGLARRAGGAGGEGEGGGAVAAAATRERRVSMRPSGVGPRGARRQGQ